MTSPDVPPCLTRRRLVKAAATTGAVAAAGAVAGTGLLAPPAEASEATTAALSGTALATAGLVADDPLLHLLRRATYGPTTESIDRIRVLGARRWLDEQLNPGTIADDECDALLSRLPLAALSIAGVHARVKAGTIKRYGWDVMRQVQLAAVARAIWSRRQLLEVMVDFWSNHLNVPCLSGEAWDNRSDYDRSVIRRHAFGRFADLLKASARHPAMLAYLNNRSSTKQSPNENYGRELLELHTVGLVHSEADVRNAARLLTGLTVNRDTGGFRYDRSRHATGPVKVLGFSHANRTDTGGLTAAMALLDYLAMHPATARRIAYKLCVRFVADDPPARLVDQLAKVYLANRTAIAPVLRALFGSAEFAASAGAKVRTPLEDVAATVRVLGLRPEAVHPAQNPAGTKGLYALLWILESAGHGPLAWGPPNGYPDVASAWASPAGHLTRWNTHLNLAAGWYPAQLGRPDSLVEAFVPKLPATYGGLVDAAARRIFGRTMRAEHTAAVTAMLGKRPGDALRARDNAARSGFVYLVAVLLDSPYFLVR